jgi:hypothetical protein
VNEALAAIVTTDLSALLPCAPAAIDEACIDGFIRTTGQRAYRHPLSDQEVALLRGVYDVNADGRCCTARHDARAALCHFASCGNLH